MIRQDCLVLGLSGNHPLGNKILQSSKNYIRKMMMTMMIIIIIIIIRWKWWYDDDGDGDDDVVSHSSANFLRLGGSGDWHHDNFRCHQ